MNHREPQKKDILSWLLFAPFLGCTLGLFLLTAGEETHATITIAGVLSVLPLLILGVLGDRLRHTEKTLLVSGGLLLLFMAADYLLGFRIPRSLSMAFFAVLLPLVFFLHHGLLSRYRAHAISGLVSRGTAVITGICGAMLLCRHFFDSSDTFLSSIFIISLFLALAFLAGCFFFLPSQGGTPFQGVRKAIAGEITDFARSSEPFRETKAFLFFLLVLAAAGSQLFFGFLFEAGGEPAWFTPGLLPGILLMVAAWAAFLSGKMIRDFGVTRVLTLVLVIYAGMIPALGIAETAGEIMVLILVSVFFLGVTTVSILALYARIVPRNKGAQCFGYFFLVLLLGVFVGTVLARRDPFGTDPTLNFLLFIIALPALQRVHALRVWEAGAVSEEAGWDMNWIPGTSSQGLVKHTLFSRMIQALARGFAEVFFGRIRIYGCENLRADAGAILVANHPNTFLDPLLITAMAPGRLHYWAKSTLWKLPILGSILDSLGAIPIHRRQDAQGRSNDNRQTMDTATRKLKNGAHVLIFPEGVSAPGLSLKPIKTGAARLGFQVLRSCREGEEIPIVPIGIDYTEATLFRTHVTVRIGEPVRLTSFRELYERDERAAVREVTEIISERLKNLLPHLEDPELENLVHRIHHLYGEHLLRILGEKDENSARKAISEAVNHYQKLDPDTLYLFDRRLDAYYTERSRLSTPDNHPPIPFRDLLKMLAGFFSFASYGLFTNWIPYRLTGRIAEWFTTATVWKATAKMGVGALVFPFYYFFLGLILYHTVGPLTAGLLVLSVLLSAFIALGALNRFAFRFSQLRILWQAFWTQDTNDDLEAMKVSLIQDLERFRESYAFFKTKETES